MGLTTLIYWRGLSGPFLLDDPYALNDVGEWLNGEQSLWKVLFGNESLLMHRALAMASFAFNAWLGGDSAFSLKLGNVLHHLVAAPLLYFLLRRMFSHDVNLTSRSSAFALLLIALWLLHPLHVSTVLYIVQRMAQVATLCTLTGLLFYVVVRDRMAQGRITTPRAITLLSLGIPVLTFLAIQGKQNGAVLPVLCLVLELAYYQPPRPRSLWILFVVLVVLPACAVLVSLIVGSDIIYGGYWLYDFNLNERLLTESRAMWAYVINTFAPYSPGMGIYADDFIVSRGWLTPPTTLIAVAGLLVMSVIAVALRRRTPSLFAGWFLFLVGHAVEGSILPLEMYYEHRNYFPMLGLLMCALSVFNILCEWLKQRNINSHRIVLITCTGALLVMLLQTAGRVNVWRNLESILVSSVEAHPRSLRANFAYLNALMASKQYAEADKFLSKIIASSDTELRAYALIYKLNSDCAIRHEASPEELQHAISLIREKRITLTLSQTLGGLADKAERSQHACGRLGFMQLAKQFRALADNASDQPADSFTRYTARHQSARMYAAAGDFKNALKQSKLAWQPTAPVPYSGLLIRMLIVNGELGAADSILAEARLRAKSYDERDQAGLDLMEDLIRQARQSSGVLKRKLDTPLVTSAPPSPEQSSHPVP